MAGEYWHDPEFQNRSIAVNAAARELAYRLSQYPDQQRLRALLTSLETGALIAYDEWVLKRESLHILMREKGM